MEPIEEGINEFTELHNKLMEDIKTAVGAFKKNNPDMYPILVVSDNARIYLGRSVEDCPVISSEHIDNGSIFVVGSRFPPTTDKKQDDFRGLSYFLEWGDHGC